MPDMPKAMKAALLPQYLESGAFMERFLDAIHCEGGEIARAENHKGIKLVDGSELSTDALDYFERNKSALEKEFLTDLTEEIGSQKAKWFCDVLAKDWYDGKGLRNGPRVIDLKVSIKQSLIAVLPHQQLLSSIVEKSNLEELDPMLKIEDVQRILKINRQMLTRHLEEWKALHPNSDSISNDDIFLRRGLALKEPINTDAAYKEWDYINSYSLAFSAPEKFAQMIEGGHAAIVNGDIHLFDGRIIFFSPFVPGMAVGQFEAGVIPALSGLSIKLQGCHGGIREYILNPRP